MKVFYEMFPNVPGPVDPVVTREIVEVAGVIAGGALPPAAVNLLKQAIDSLKVDPADVLSCCDSDEKEPALEAHALYATLIKRQNRWPTDSRLSDRHKTKLHHGYRKLVDEWNQLQQDGAISLPLTSSGQNQCCWNQWYYLWNMTCSDRMRPQI